MHTQDMIIGSGFYLTAHSFVTREGYCMPVFGRTRDEYTYVLTAEPAGEDMLPMDENIAMMGNRNAHDALKYGSIGFFTTDAIPLIPYHVFSRWQGRNYLLFAVRAGDVYYRQDPGMTMVAADCKLYFIEGHFPDQKDEGVPEGVKLIEELEWETPPGYVVPVGDCENSCEKFRQLSDSMMAQKKMSAQNLGVQLAHDKERAEQIMKSLAE